MQVSGCQAVAVYSPVLALWNHMDSRHVVSRNLFALDTRSRHVKSATRYQITFVESKEAKPMSFIMSCSSDSLPITGSTGASGFFGVR